MKQKIKIKKEKNKTEQNHLAMEAAVCHTVYLLPKQVYLQMFIAMSHWSGLKLLAFATLSVLNPQLGLFSDILFIVIGILQLWVCRTGPFIHSSSSQIGYMWGRPTQSPSWVWVETELASLPALLCPCHQASSPTLPR